MAAPRNAKLADQIKVVIAQTLERRVKDPRLGFLTLTEVRLSGDNREATVFYTVLGDDAERAGTAAALDSATGMLRTAVGQQLGIKFAPSLEFVLDGETGCVVDPRPEALAEALDRLHADAGRTAAMGRAGRARYDSLGIGWGPVVARLLS